MIILLHGGGLTSASWSLCSSYLKTSFSICAIDFRGHGETKTSDDTDLSVQTLCNDVISIVKYLSKEKKRKFVLVGHSLGGAIAIHSCGALQNDVKIIGLIIIDVVEGTALSSLDHIKKILLKRPKDFEKISEAIHWSIYSNLIQKVESACVSIPSQLKENEDGKFYWKTDLLKTEKYWNEWYQGISEIFLNLKIPKLLLVAGMDRLDTPLTKGQIQGKFQMKIISQTGHFIQEDNPKETAIAIEQFVKKFENIILK